MFAQNAGTLQSSGNWTANDSGQIGFQIVLSAIWAKHRFLVSYSWVALALNFRAIIYSHRSVQFFPLI